MSATAELQRVIVATPRGDVEVAYRRTGAGRARHLLLLHGIGSNSRSFARQLDGLANDAEVVAWDAPGYGKSEDPPPDFTLADFADAAAELIGSLGWRHAVVLGHSFGGVVAQELYRRHPETVSSLILSDTNPGSGSLPEPERSERLERRLNDLRTLTPRVLAERRAPNLVPPDAPASLVAELTDMMAQIKPAGYAAAALAMGTADLREHLPDIKVPTLVVHGERDTVIPATTGAALAARIPNAQLVIIPGAGHASNQHLPAAYNQAIREFLDTLD